MLRSAFFINALVALAFFALPLLAADHKVEKLDEPAPKDGLAPEIAALLSPTGFKVIRGESRVVCEVWLCLEWPVKDVKAAGELLYPFQPGQVMGVARYPRKGSDFGTRIFPPVFTPCATVCSRWMEPMWGPARLATFCC